MRALAFAAVLALSGAANAGASPLTPMNAGFHQRLECNGGHVDIAVLPGHPKLAPNTTAVMTTLSLGDAQIKTTALRSVDAAGNIYAYGYAMPGFVKRFHKQLLLPASPPAAGSHTTYFNVSGVKITKRYEGMYGPFGAPAPTQGGYVFSDYLNGHKLNTVTYIPAVGVTNAAFIGLRPDHTDLICHSPGF